MFDLQSEAIAHFIGHFQLLVERAMLRLEHDRLVHAARQIDDPPPLPHVTVKVESLLAPADLSFVAPRLPDAGLPAGATVPGAGWAAPVAGAAGPVPAQPGLPAPPAALSAVALPAASGQITWTIPPADQVAVITLQYNLAQDQDIWLDGIFATAASPLGAPIPFAALAADLEALVALAGQLMPVAPPGASLTGAAAMAQLRDDLATTDPAWAPAVAQITLLRRGDPLPDEDGATLPFAGGIVVNGVQASAVPDHLQMVLDARTPAPEDGPNDEVTLQTDPAPLAQQVTTGGNLLINETALGHDWLDAPVIAVAGSVTSLAVIAQVNLLSDRDRVEGPVDLAAAGGAGAGGAAAASAAFNIASLTSQSRLAAAQALANARTDAARDAAGDGPADPVLPAHWAVTRIEGDVLIENWVLKINLLSDDDVARFETGHHGLQVGMGENTLLNLDSLLALGAHYDLIMIGGQMIDLTLIQQVNVLLDNDHVLLMGGAGPQGPGGVSSHGNTLWNEAALNRIGVDYHTDLDAGFARVLQALADGGDDLSAIAGDPLFQGFEALRVLYIEGDLIRLDAITQVNILGDSDQIAVLADHYAGEGLLPLDLAAGDNVLINAAALTQAGVDSTVMAGGGVYSDAVIWQAGLLDTDATPLEGGLGALATEAVAFLAEGMIDPILPPEADLAIAPDPGSAGPGHDVMHSVLT
ncbi:hypothetical protein [Pontitalea aquivivens]|uniref:hypothetical protein n=1 Tax=Pontitalea aquivivens TaxID=3388663 RepID=UPI003970E775